MDIFNVGTPFTSPEFLALVAALHTKLGDPNAFLDDTELTLCSRLIPLTFTHVVDSLRSAAFSAFRSHDDTRGSLNHEVFTSINHTSVFAISSVIAFLLHENNHYSVLLLDMQPGEDRQAAYHFDSAPSCGHAAVAAHILDRLYRANMIGPEPVNPEDSMLVKVLHNQVFTNCGVHSLFAIKCVDEALCLTDNNIDVELRAGNIYTALEQARDDSAAQSFRELLRNSLVPLLMVRETVLTPSITLPHLLSSRVISPLVMARRVHVDLARDTLEALFVGSVAVIRTLDLNDHVLPDTIGEDVKSHHHVAYLFGDMATGLMQGGCLAVASNFGHPHQLFISDSCNGPAVARLQQLYAKNCVLIGHTYGLAVGAFITVLSALKWLRYSIDDGGDLQERLRSLLSNGNPTRSRADSSLFMTVFGRALVARMCHRAAEMNKTMDVASADAAVIAQHSNAVFSRMIAAVPKNKGPDAPPLGRSAAELALATLADNIQDIAITCAPPRIVQRSPPMMWCRIYTEATKSAPARDLHNQLAELIAAAKLLDATEYAVRVVLPTVRAVLANWPAAAVFWQLSDNTRFLTDQQLEEGLRAHLVNNGTFAVLLYPTAHYRCRAGVRNSTSSHQIAGNMALIDYQSLFDMADRSSDLAQNTRALMRETYVTAAMYKTAAHYDVQTLGGQCSEIFDHTGVITVDNPCEYLVTTVRGGHTLVPAVIEWGAPESMLK